MSAVSCFGSVFAGLRSRALLAIVGIRMDLMPVIMLTPPAGQHGTGNVVPNAEERGRHRGQRIGSERRQRQSRSQSGILHADLEGDGFLLCITEALRIYLVHKFGETEAQRVSAQVVQNDHRDGKQRGSHEQLLSAFTVPFTALQLTA